MKRAEKTFFVQNLTEQLKSASSVVLVDYSGLSVKKQQELKKRLAAVGSNLSVVKNTLFKLAAGQAKMSEAILSEGVLSGPTALVLAEKDPIAPLQILYTFAQEFEVPNFKVGIVEGKFFDKDELIKLAQLPSKQMLFGLLTASVAQPILSLTSILQGNLEKLIWILQTNSESEALKPKS